MRITLLRNRKKPELLHDSNLGKRRPNPYRRLWCPLFGICVKTLLKSRYFVVLFQQSACAKFVSSFEPPRRDFPRHPQQHQLWLQRIYVQDAVEHQETPSITRPAVNFHVMCEGRFAMGTHTIDDGRTFKWSYVHQYTDLNTMGEKRWGNRLWDINTRENNLLQFDE